MPFEKFRERTIKIAKGEYIMKRDEPKIWFESLNAMAQILNKDNMYLLKVIDETRPESITALARRTVDRSLWSVALPQALQNNLSRIRRPYSVPAALQPSVAAIRAIRLPGLSIGRLRSKRM